LVQTSYQSLFFDGTSETLFSEIPESTVIKSRVLLNIERFEIGQSYVIAKVQNRYGDKITINIQGGRPGIELQESLFKINDQDRGGSPHAYLLTKPIQMVRKLPVIGMRDCLKNSLI
jgi:hypothetical protein